VPHAAGSGKRPKQINAADTRWLLVLAYGVLRSGHPVLNRFINRELNVFQIRAVLQGRCPAFSMEEVSAWSNF